MKLLYLSCHEVLEYDEVTLFQEMGIDVVSLGETAVARLRPATCQPGADQECVAGEGDPRDHLTRRFVDRFDAIVVMHESAWIVNNWEVIRHKPVIWRTIGQSLPERELMMQSLSLIHI